MVITPWGDTSTLRERRLRPGKGTPRVEVERNQRERLYAAMVAVAGSKGYAQTTVPDLAKLSGVSSRSFYELFSDKDECLLASLDEVLSRVSRLAISRLREAGDAQQRGRVAIDTFLEVAAAQPATARLCLVEAFAAGPAAQERIDSVVAAFAELLRVAFEERPRAIPEEIAWAMISGVAHVVYRRLVSGREAQITELGPALFEWCASLPPPPRPLRARGRRSGPVIEGTPPFAAHVPGERVLRGFAAAVAAKGYAATTIADIAAAASISQQTFYAHFADKPDVLRAAIDSSGAQMVAATLPAVRRSAQWPGAVHVALAAICGFLASEPAFAHLRTIEVLRVGPEAVRQRDRAGTEIVEAVRVLCAQEIPEIDPIAAEATTGAISALLYRTLRAGSSKNLVEVAPVATYLVLAPILGAEQACEVALG